MPDLSTHRMLLGAQRCRPDDRAAGGGQAAAFLLGAAALALWVAVVRYPYAHAVAFDGDEGLFLLIGQRWLHGIWPYTDIWDVKPPGLFMVFALAEKAFGESLLAARLASGLAVLVTALGLYRFASRHFGSRRPAIVAAFLYPPYTLLMGGLGSKAEIFVAPFVVWACRLVLGGWSGRPAAPFRLAVAGALFGCAVLVKQTAAFETLFAFVFVAWQASRSKPYRCALWFAAGAVAPLMLAAAGFGWAGHLDALAAATVTAALGRLSGDGVAISDAGTRFLAQLRPMLPLLVAAAFLLAERRALKAAPDRQALKFLAGWTAAAAVAALVMRATYDSYVLPLLPPFALAASRFLEYLMGRGRWQRGAAAGWLALSIAYPFAFLRFTDYPALAASRLPLELADYLRGQGPSPGDTLYVVDQEPVIYFLSGVAPPTRYPLPQHLLCAFPTIGFDAEAEIRRIMETGPRWVVLSASRRRAVCQQPRRMVILEPYLESRYRLVRRFSTSFESAELFGRRDRPMPAASAGSGAETEVRGRASQP